MVITGRFVLLVALGAIPIILFDLGLNGLGLWLLVCLAVAILDMLLAASPRNIRIERKIPRKLRLTESAVSTVYLTNLNRVSARLNVRDAWQPTANAKPDRQPVYIPGGERRMVEFQITPTRRGELQSSFVAIRSFGPFRFTARQVVLATLGTIKVLPPFHSRKHLPSRIQRLRELEGQAPVMIRGQGTEFDSLRDYVRGDDVRSIDWRATARRQEVTVRTWRPERDRRVVMVVDTGRTAAARIADETRLDTYFESTLLLSALASHAGDRVDAFGYDRRLRFRVTGLTGAEHMSKLIDSVASVEPELIETDWSDIPSQVEKLSNGKSLVVLLTTLDSLGSSRGLLAVLPQLTSKHTVLVATVTDGSLLETVHNREDVAAIYQAAAAEKALLDLAQLTASVTRLGAHVVSAAPENLPPALADKYLALKAAGQL